MIATASAGPRVHGDFSIPSLDGMRAIAVLLVFAAHGYTIPGFHGGHVGVAIFFFLSGYLITTLLRREQDRHGSISIGRFYLRRLLRIYPPALLAIAVSVTLGATGLLAATTTRWGVLAEVLNFTNYYVVFNGRDGLPPRSNPLWSLAVEEHYYIIFPVVLILLLRSRRSYRAIGWGLVTVAAMVGLWRIVLWQGGAGFDRLYISTDTRIDGLLFGSAMALLLNPVYGDRIAFPDRLRPLLRWATPVAVAVFAITAQFAGSYWLRLTVVDTVQYLCLVPVFWAMIARPESVGGRLLNHPWAIRIGLLSFSIYLFHAMVITLVDSVVSFNPLMNLIALPMTIALAQIVYLAVEQPFARLRRRLETGSRAAGRSRMNDPHRADSGANRDVTGDRPDLHPRSTGD